MGSKQSVIARTVQERQKELGLRIRTLRGQKGWSQELLAHNCGTNRGHIGDIERGKYDVRTVTLLKIANALQVSLKELFKGITGIE
jgi:transcriptional regulator with XRE-family HTH domain